MKYRRVYSHHFHTTIAESIYTTPNSIQCLFLRGVSPQNIYKSVYRRARGDMIETYKLLHDKYYGEYSQLVKLHASHIPRERTRVHSSNLCQEGSKLNLNGHCIEFKYYADGIHSGLTPPACFLSTHELSYVRNCNQSAGGKCPRHRSQIAGTNKLGRLLEY